MKRNTVRRPPVVSLSLPPSISPDVTLYVLIDETGNLGISETEEYYVIGACLVRDVDQFSRAVENLNLETEFKAADNHEKVMDVIKGSESEVLCVYHIALLKEPGQEISTPMKHMIHVRMLQKVADRILSDIPNNLDVTLDDTSMIPRKFARNIFLKNRNLGDRKIEARTKASVKTVSLQTNDAYVWLMGQLYNANNRHIYMLMDRMDTAILSRSDWLGRLHDDYTDIIAAEDEDLAMLRWQYWHIYPKKCYDKSEYEGKLNGYPLDWNEFLDWAYEELGKSYRHYPKKLPRWEDFRADHPIPKKYSYYIKNESTKSKRTECAKIDPATGIVIHTPKNKSNEEYKKVRRQNDRPRDSRGRFVSKKQESKSPKKSSATNNKKTSRTKGARR